MNDRIRETRFRTTATGREAMAPAGEVGDHVHYEPLRRAGLGVITSKRTHEWTFYERLAFELAGVGGDPKNAIVPFCTPAHAKALHEKGLIK